MQGIYFFEIFEWILLTTFFILSALLFSGVSVVSKLILIILIFFILVLNIYKYQSQKLKIDFLPNDILIFCITFFLYLFLHTFFISKNVYDSKLELTNFFIYITTFFTILLVKKENLEKSITYTFFIISFVVFLSYVFDVEDRQRIVYYFFYNPNIFAGFCVMNIFFSYEQIKRNIIYKNIVLINLFLAILLIIFLRSYSAIFVTMFVISILLRKYYKISLWTIGIFIIFLITLFSVINFNTVIDRILWLLIGIRIFLKNMIFGVGLGNFKYFYLSNTSNLTTYSIATIYVHNYFLQFAIETGIVGIAFILVFIFTILRRGKKELYFYPIIAILFLNIFDYNLYIPQNSILLFSMFAGYIKFQDYNFETDLIYKYTYFVIVTLIFFCGLYLIKNFYEIEKLYKQPDKKNLEKIISIDKTCWQAYIDLSKIYFVEKKFLEAANNLESAIKYNPQYSETYFYLSLIYKVLNIDKDRAYKNLSQAIRINPKASQRYIKYFNSASKR